MGKSGLKDRSLGFIWLLAALIVGMSVLVAGLYRFTGIFKVKPTESRIARNLDLADSHWVEQLAELNVPSYKKDFSIYTAFSYSGAECSVTLVYATRAGVDDIRAYYLETLDGAREQGQNTAGRLGVGGTAKGRRVDVENYFSEVTSLVRVDIEMDGVYAEQIRRTIIASFPQPAIDAAPEIAALAAGQSREGYVLYSSDAFALDSYADVPAFSRAYAYEGTEAELRARIDTLAGRFTDPADALIGGGTAEIKYGGYLYQIKPVVSGGETLVAIVVQSIPAKDANS
jgi:hypothetical protein